VAILLCNLRKTTCRDVRAGCSLRRPSPARKQVVDKDPRLHKSDLCFKSDDLRACILPYCSKPRELKFKLRNRDSTKQEHYSLDQVASNLIYVEFIFSIWNVESHRKEIIRSERIIQIYRKFLYNYFLTIIALSAIILFFSYSHICLYTINIEPPVITIYVNIRSRPMDYINMIRVMICYAFRIFFAATVAAAPIPKCVTVLYDNVNKKIIKILNIL